MYILIVYDVAQERVSKIMKICREYLDHVQNSVFEGEVGLADYVSIKKQLNKIIKKDIDSIIIFKFSRRSYYEREVIGAEKNRLTSII